MTVVNIELRTPSPAGLIPADSRVSWQAVERILGPDYVVLKARTSVQVTAGAAVADIEAGLYWFTESAPGGENVFRIVPPVGPVNYRDLAAVDPASLEPTAAPDPAWVAMAGSTVASAEVVGDDLILERTDGTVVNAGNVRGPVGPFNDAAMASAVQDPAALTGRAARRIFTPRVTLFEPSPGALRRWRAYRGQVESGQRQGHITCIGDSIMYGAAATGASSPKWRNSWPGRLRALLDSRLGAAGTGIVHATPETLTTNPEWDPRWAFSGSVVNFAFGLHRESDYRLQAPASGETYLEFAAECTEFVIYSAAGGGSTGLASIDGGANKTFRNTSTSSITYDLPSVFPSSNPVITRVPAGARGVHKLRITRPATHDLHILGVEARIETPGTYRVTNSGANGRSLSSSGFGSVNNDEANALWGRPLFFDMPDADLAIIGLGINDFQTGRPVEDTRTSLVNAVQRQRSAGLNGQGRSHPNGDAVLLWNPAPSNWSPTFEEHREVFYDVARDQDVALIDLTTRWGDYATSSALGQHADTIHPTDAGAQDVASAVYESLFRG